MTCVVCDNRGCEFCPKVERKENNVRVKVIHFRRPKKGSGVNGLYTKYELEDLGYLPDAKGGMTVVNIYGENGVRLASGSAECSDKDNYSRSLGRRIALGRALKDLNRKGYGPGSLPSEAEPKIGGAAQRLVDFLESGGDTAVLVRGIVVNI